MHFFIPGSGGRRSDEGLLVRKEAPSPASPAAIPQGEGAQRDKPSAKEGLSPIGEEKEARSLRERVPLVRGGNSGLLGGGVDDGLSSGEHGGYLAVGPPKTVNTTSSEVS